MVELDGPAGMGGLGWPLDLVTLEVFPTLNDSGVLWEPGRVTVGEGRVVTQLLAPGCTSA